MPKIDQHTATLHVKAGISAYHENSNNNSMTAEFPKFVIESRNTFFRQLHSTYRKHDSAREFGTIWAAMIQSSDLQIK